MNPEFVKLTAAGFVILTAASSIKKKRANKKTARKPVNYDPIMHALILVG